MSVLDQLFKSLGIRVVSTKSYKELQENNNRLRDTNKNSKAALLEANRKLKILNSEHPILLFKQLKVMGEPVPYHLAPDIYGKKHYKLLDVREDRLFYQLAQAVVGEEGRSLLYYDRLFYLYQSLNNAFQTYEKRRSSKDETFAVLEAGVHKGGGSYFIASVLNHLFGDQATEKVKMFSVDTFEGHAEEDIPGAKEDIKEGNHYPGMFNDTSYEDVKEYLSVFPFVEVIPSRIQDAESKLADHQFDMIHLDMDLYHPTLYALNFYKDRLKPWGVFVLDDMRARTCPGVEQALQEFLDQNPAQFHYFYIMSGQGLLVKLPNSH